MDCLISFLDCSLLAQFSYRLLSLNISRQLFDYKTEETKGEFHLNSIRIGDHFFKTHVPGLGGNYLEFQDHPSALSVEIISGFFHNHLLCFFTNTVPVTFIVMEILRRGRFYPKQCKCSEIPKLWKWCDAHASVVSLG